MSAEFSRPRRFALAVAALLCGALLFRAQIGDALVIRGDDYMYRGEPLKALERYRRALAVSPSSRVAADRYVFVTLQRQTPAALRAAVNVADGYLHRNPGDPAVLADRALCYLHLRNYALAERDFERAAIASHAAADYVFAGWAAKHAGDRRGAARLWRQALRVRHGYRPAVLALGELAR